MSEATICAADTDEALVSRGRLGDQFALGELFRRHHGVAQRVAHRLLGHEEDAKDAVQNGFINALRHLADFDGRSGFRTWLLRIVTNAALDLGRSRRRRSVLSLRDSNSDDSSDATEPAIDDDPSLALRRQDLGKILNQALDKLSGEKRATFVLFIEAGLSYEEIAELQNVPIGTVMSRIYYARRKLQSDLQGVDGL